MFQFARLAPHALCIQAWVRAHYHAWVSPFGHRGINACCQLPRAFRRLPRPSSPLTAKASTVDAYSLDHITRSRLRIDQHTSISPNCLNDTSSSARARRLLRPKFSKSLAWTSTSGKIKFFSVRSIQRKASKLVELTGIEPVTPCLQSRCSPS